MGAPKQKWLAAEEEALRAGVEKHGAGKWRTIQKDPEFSHCLSSRSNIDLKDKWRNLSVSASGQSSREKSRTPKVKALPAMPFSTAETPTPLAPVKNDGLAKEVNDNVEDTKLHASFIIEAISTLQEPNGADISEISKFIQEKHAVSSNFQRLLSSKLRRLAVQGRIEKVQGGYKVKDPAFANRTSTVKSKSLTQRTKPVQSSSSAPVIDTLEETFASAAYRVAEAEAKSFFAAEATKEFERVAKMAEETEVMLHLAEEIHQKCSQGDVFVLEFEDED